MKAALDAIIQRDQAEYLERLHPQTDSLLREMEQYGGSTMSPVLIGSCNVRGNHCTCNQCETGTRDRHGDRLYDHPSRSRRW